MTVSEDDGVAGVRIPANVGGSSTSRVAQAWDGVSGTGGVIGVSGGTSVRDALDGAITAIAAAGCETPRLDAELLLAHALGVSRERLLTDRELTVSGPAVRTVQDAVRRRAVEREPVAYITGVRAFRRLRLAVDRRALIPRPETELLVEVALARLPPRACVLDVGTGSGAVALALADERSDLTVSATDISEDALALARANGERLGLSVRWLHADLLAAVPDAFDAIVSNPPYVPEAERASLAPEILRHEPPGALFAGPDGLALIRRLLAELAERRRVRLAALEIGIGQAAEVARLLRVAGFPQVRTERDLAGLERAVVGERDGCENSRDPSARPAMREWARNARKLEPVPVTQSPAEILRIERRR